MVAIDDQVVGRLRIAVFDQFFHQHVSIRAVQVHARFEISGFGPPLAADPPEVPTGGLNNAAFGHNLDVGFGGRTVVSSTACNDNSPLSGSWESTRSPTRISSTATSPLLVWTCVPATRHERWTKRYHD